MLIYVYNDEVVTLTSYHGPQALMIWRKKMDFGRKGRGICAHPHKLLSLASLGSVDDTFRANRKWPELSEIWIQLGP